jgi:hypothetical protein
VFPAISALAEIVGKNPDLADFNEYSALSTSARAFCTAGE